MDAPLKVGLCLARADMELRYRQLVSAAGCELAGVYPVAGVPPAIDADAWLVALDDAADNPALEAWLEQQTAPVIFDDAGASDDEGWQRRLARKLAQLAGMVSLANQGAGSVSGLRAVWVLAASTGGPAAVKAFLQAMPSGLGIAFVYAQHIDQGFDVTLVQAISRCSHYAAVLAGHGSLLLPDSVTIIRPDQETELLVNGTLMVHRRPWAGSYSPAINQVMANVASVYGNRSGAIVFTGMGDDGKAACRLMRAQGGEVWVQTPASCTVSSMPEEALSTGVPNLQGTPEELASALAGRYQPRMDQRQVE